MSDYLGNVSTPRQRASSDRLLNLLGTQTKESIRKSLQNNFLDTRTRTILKRLLSPEVSVYKLGLMMTGEYVFETDF